MSSESVITTLNKILASEYVLLVKTRQFHWNLKSLNFPALHKLFGDHYEELSDSADTIAERVAQLDGIATGSMAEFIQNALIKEAPTQHYCDLDMIDMLMKDHQSMIESITPLVRILNDKLEDPGTADLLTGMLHMHSKAAWFLKSSLGCADQK